MRAASRSMSYYPPSALGSTYRTRFPPTSACQWRFDERAADRQRLVVVALEPFLDVETEAGHPVVRRHRGLPGSGEPRQHVAMARFRRAPHSEARLGVPDLRSRCAGNTAARRAEFVGGTLRREWLVAGRVGAAPHPAHDALLAIERGAVQGLLEVGAFNVWAWKYRRRGAATPSAHDRPIF